MATRQSGWRRLVIGATEDAPARPAEAAAPAAPDAGFARIERGVEMSGRLVTERPLRIEGEFRGEIESASIVLVVEGGSVEAPIRARTVEIRGAVVGNVVAARELVLRASGRLHGDVEAPSLLIERGAFFTGAMKMYRPQATLQDAADAPAADAAEPAAPALPAAR